MVLEFSDAEADVLADILDRALRDLREEIYKTETYTYKQMLKGREAIVTALLERVHTEACVR